MHEPKDGLTDTWGFLQLWSADAIYAALAYESSYTSIDFSVWPATLTAGTLIPCAASLRLNLGDSAQFGAIVERSEFDPYGGDEGDLMSYLLSGRFGLSERIALKGQIAGMLDGSDLDLDMVLTVGADYTLGDFRPPPMRWFPPRIPTSIRLAPPMMWTNPAWRFPSGMIHKF